MPINLGISVPKVEHAPEIATALLARMLRDVAVEEDGRRHVCPEDCKVEAREGEVIVKQVYPDRGAWTAFVEVQTGWPARSYPLSSATSRSYVLHFHRDFPDFPR